MNSNWSYKQFRSTVANAFDVEGRSTVTLDVERSDRFNMDSIIHWATEMGYHAIEVNSDTIRIEKCVKPDFDTQIRNLLGDDSPQLEEIASTIINEAWGDDTPYHKKGRAVLEAYLECDVNKFCVALTGWSFEDIFKKAGVIGDTNNTFSD